jgi:hypothetical protein
VAIAVRVGTKEARHGRERSRCHVAVAIIVGIAVGGGAGDPCRCKRDCRGAWNGSAECKGGGAAAGVELELGLSSDCRSAAGVTAVRTSPALSGGFCGPSNGQRGQEPFRMV